MCAVIGKIVNWNMAISVPEGAARNRVLPMARNLLARNATSHADSPQGLRTLRPKEGAIRKLTVNLLGAAALFAAGVALLRQGTHRPEPPEAKVDDVPPGETVPGKIKLERLRELGI